MACNKGSEDFVTFTETMVTVDHKPSISVSLDAVDPNDPDGPQIATVTYDFPQTDDALQREVSLKWYGGATISSFHPTDQQGTWQTTLSCPPGDSFIQAVASACGDTEASDVALVPACETPKQDCNMCSFGPGSVCPDGSAPGSEIFGLNAKFAYQARGVGQPKTPGASTWTSDTGLGRYWIHEFATRIVPDPDPSHVWLITPTGTFREFTDTNSDGTYDQAVPSDEHRTLEHNQPTTGEWRLTDLDGTITTFNPDGSFKTRANRLGHTWAATYSGGLLDTVTFPDGRHEVFTYVAGRLDEIQQVGLETDGTAADCLGDSECRTWRFTWNADDLQRIEYPDGTAREFTYADPSFPGYMTLRELVGTDGSRRVEAGWEYTAAGRVYRTWKGASSYTDTLAVEKYEFTAYDNEALPSTVQVIDSFGNPTTYSIGYDDQSIKPKLLSVTGDCPSCGGPNTEYEYDDPLHPLRPTAEIDAKGHRTEYTYNPNGTIATRTEAAGTTEARFTSYAYDANFPALRILEQRPSTSAGARETSWAYDPNTGALTSMTIQGSEIGYDADEDGIPEDAFQLTTNYRNFNAAGQPGEIDPPGFDNLGDPTDLTTLTYNVPGRNGLLPDTQAQPELSAPAQFGYDGLNRQTTVTDPNGIVTQTTYDSLDRVDHVIEDANGLSLLTDYEYNALGELAMIKRPRGNRTVYIYDHAGRLEEVRQQAGASLSAGDERVFYELNSFGQRTREAHEVYDPAASPPWVTKSATEYQYSSRCYLDKVIHNPDTGADQVTEYAYDCDGNLQKVWDANHPRFPSDPQDPPASDADALVVTLASHQETPPTQFYVYDALDRLEELREPWTAGTDCTDDLDIANCAVTIYDYDVQDHLTSVIDAEGNTTTYKYSDRDLLTEEVSPVHDASQGPGKVTHRYGAHGALVETTDARGITSTRTLDGLRRVTLVDYPDPTLDTSYVYDQVPAECSSDLHEGRLAEVIRNGTSTPYCYDALGRTTRDGELTYAYDLNSNRTQITYPNNVVATYTHDLVSDREETLTLQVGADPAQTLVTSAAYLPGGPLTSAGLGNGLTETRTYTDRYHPTQIDVPGVTSLAYTTDAMGNITRIDRSLLGNTYVLSYQYQDTQYFLTQGHGPWGQRTWTYDKIGNRLTENRGPSDTDNPLPESTYTYGLNPAGGNAPKLLEVTGPLGDEELVSSHSFAYDGAGNQYQITPDGGTTTLLSYDDASRLTTLGDGSDETSVTYDGRGFLTLSHRTTVGSADYLSTEAVYDSQGLLHCVERSGSQSGLTFDESTYVLYFAGRPIAQVTVDNQGVSPDEILYLTTDHLGTPIAATDSSGVATWQGGLSPFGMPYSYADTGGGGGDPGDGDALMSSATQSLASSPKEAGIFLRFPGQWDDGTFEGYVPGGIYQNVHRWYETGTGRYSRPDPLGLRGGLQLYSYARGNPTFFVDPLGLVVQRCCRDIEVNWFVDTASQILGVQHCFIKTDTVEAGMGPADNGPLPACPFGADTAVVDHKDQSTWPGTTCEVIPDVNEDCVNAQLEIGRPTGEWSLGNQCNSFANGILDRCRNKCEEPPEPKITCGFWGCVSPEGQPL